MMIVMIFSIILCFIVIGITVLVTNKAYDVLPNSLKIDPHPDEDKEKNKQPK
ncbi:YtzI protein [Bacillus nitroreducens]